MVRGQPGVPRRNCHDTMPTYSHGGSVAAKNGNTVTPFTVTPP